ncbi:hypothetical protein JW935_28720, partial [candidate division KSB1 bacterium]|nr:hypothetical protein [candidate division KSB1 bacterium]
AKTEIGVITNALLVNLYRKQLIENPPDYIDVSADGLPDAYNAIRGRNAFSLLEPNLIWLNRHFSDRLWLTPTLHKGNMDDLPKWISFYNEKFNITRFSIGFYANLPYTDQTIKLTKADYQRFTHYILADLERINLKSPVKMIIELDANQQLLIDQLENFGALQPGKAFARDTLQLKNGLTLHFHIARKPVGLWKSVRVSPEGYWIAAEDLLRVREYPRLATANVRECDYNAKILYITGLDSRRFYTLYKQSESMMVP